jgi:hypothetical protein
MASMSTRLQRPVPSWLTLRWAICVLGPMGEPTMPGETTMPFSPAVHPVGEGPVDLLVGRRVDVFLDHRHEAHQGAPQRPV